MLKKIIYITILLSVLKTFSQQDIQFTQYMYNTMVVNPAFAGTQGYSVVTLAARTQWVGLSGAPNTQTLSFQTPLHNVKGLGLGVNLMNDAIGPVSEMFVDANVSYAIDVSDTGKLALGMKLGGRYFKLDATKFKAEDLGEAEIEQSVSKVFATVGAGLYFYADKYYIGVSVPNFLTTEHYDHTIGTQGNVAKERFHIYTMAGYVFDISDDLKFKPSMLFKMVEGSPLSTDISANFLINTKIHAGISYRLEDSLGFLAGFQVSDKMYLGYTYDLTTSAFRTVARGSHELLLRYEFDNTPRRLKCTNPGLLWF